MLDLGDQERLRTIIQHAIDGNHRWLSDHNIGCGDKGQHLVLNYGPCERNEFDRLVRGLVVRKQSAHVRDLLELIASFPFVRF